MVDTDKLRVRNKATKNSATLGMVVEGDKLEIVELGDEWTKVIFEQASAYVATEYIEQTHIIGTGMTIEEEQEAIRAEEERQAAIKAEEERKKKEAAEALVKQRATLTQKYGKQYVDIFLIFILSNEEIRLHT